MKELDCPKIFVEKQANENSFKTFRFTHNLNNLIKPNNSLYIMCQSERAGSLILLQLSFCNFET